jgi:hypothetical protein
MNAPLPLTAPNRFAFTTTAAIHVIVIHDSQTAAANARESIQMLALRNGIRAQTSVWSFDALARLDSRHASFRRAAEADVIFVSAQASSTLPTYVSSWLTHCLRENRHGAPVIAAVYDHGQQSGGGMPELRRELTSVAARWRLPLLCNDELPERLMTELEDLEQPVSRAAAPFGLDRLLALPRRGSWGIKD